ncbi:MAG: hypothetical protein K6F29_10235 [Bacteroidales bacterium]|nr:hypothetical protein [Bacteroidales bacterium]
MTQRKQHEHQPYYDKTGLITDKRHIDSPLWDERAIRKIVINAGKEPPSW